ncbi:3-dehydroquinate synthase [Lederbergia lenta]|uniref:3-dehydroquinate synthase n=1 Tax=Lederbergia lenta TaxID=1467 RepID=A0A2X4YXK7_LEDLE|nr:3-dehydroquinate synthase [Lederbergia lenta]MEC2324959.1 3-dehydroquinate synthase [Lederbergia lenta]SQI56545.1 3-dehydroquinate synthase [Lederbergia lenta]
MKVEINTPSKSYSVIIKSGAIKLLGKQLNAKKYTKLYIITDQTVGPLHLDTLKAQLPNDLEAVEFQVPSGEQAKQFSVYEQCLEFALENGLDRNSCIIAFGGGAVGDLAGFVAATYMRGIDFFQIPTTILAHDSAVGGKTAINLPLGKNMVGVFHQPETVIYDIDFLKTLPTSEIRSGFAEVVKHALIADPQLLKYLMENITSLSEITDDMFVYILGRGIEIKAAVVSEDEKETGVRAVLNFGHTLGHAIEATAGYGKYTHGEAVMIGMVYALYLSKEKLGLTYDISKFIEWIHQLGYDSHIPNYLSFDQAFQAMQRDKKSVANKPYFVLLASVGKPVLEEVEKSLAEKTFITFKQME